MQVKSLDGMSLSDKEKMSLTLEVLKIAREMLEAGHDVDDFISHGIDLIAILLPETSNSEELRYVHNFCSEPSVLKVDLVAQIGLHF